MKDFLEGLSKKLTETAEVVSNKAGEVVEIQRIRSQIQTMSKSNERDYRDIGSMIYEKFKAGEVVEPEMACICEEIAKREEVAAELEKLLADVKGESVCPECKKTVGKDMTYCPHCGTKQPEPEACEEEADACCCGEDCNCECDGDCDCDSEECKCESEEGGCCYGGKAADAVEAVADEAFEE